jgi:ubiquinone/menaquinone biosynthesis C-methylase UbiE
MDQGEASFGGSVADGYREYLEPVIFRPWAELLVDFVGVEQGHTVLDVAAGTGVVSRAVAARLQAGGRVIASDVSGAMLAHVPDEFPSDRVPLQTVECSATALDLPSACADVVLCQQGLQFMPDRTGAAREMLRVLRPGGKAGIAVWSSSPRVEPFIVYGEALQAHQVPEPFPSAYDSSNLSMGTEEVERVLSAAGFDEIVVRIERLDLQWPSVRHAVRGVFGTPYGPIIEALDSATRQSVLAQVQQRMSAADDQATRLVMTSVLARGRRG